MLPVIDLADLDTPAGRERLREVTHHVGFFYLDGHGVDRRLLDGVFSVAREFFALPEESKMSIAMIDSPHFRGYNRVGGELTNGEIDWREQIDIGPERDPVPDATDYLRLQGPNQWPAALPALKSTIEQFDAALAEVGMRLLRHWAASLDADPGIFDDAFAHAPATLIKVVRYPARPSDDHTGEQGVGAHKDSGVLTLLLLEPGSTGLQVESEDGSWIDAPARAGSFLVNIGELLEVATGGYLRATRHRVLTPAGAPERLSVPYFLNPALDATVPTITLPPHLASRARGVERDPANPLYRTYGENAWKSRTRAHPDVFRRWYPKEAGCKLD
ncbi:2-oxoglutarate and iron-dependent oxygenase domain-containing protein [Rhodococcus oxybenzonivorans]|uniref:isopenicillin N synthase family dioxygenase n=1 Tax=Rhodococcus oxybenzonivorans TaxID=1990687 RepID=UPI0029553C4D|nr:2-oxoglutarate and iron-dependent oxygenase domain-containing protein [Rhodococcus oxybenzonivorans]MDV7353588.1 2-oxoglutarate and iron-dependent oxygenase domain-containing protein [Rhodococcus oxybenzonivorans]